ncbi:hypothetical protein L208DRAFT_1278177, partial [Tricholoma matsutake]
GNRSEWSVLLDWEAMQGIKNNIMLVTEMMSTQNPHPLETHFKDDSFFQPIMQYLLGHTTSTTISERRRMVHRAEGFMIKDGKLWRVSKRADTHDPPTEQEIQTNLSLAEVFCAGAH